MAVEFTKPQTLGICTEQVIVKCVAVVSGKYFLCKVRETPEIISSN